MTLMDFSEIDFFRAGELYQDPFPYYEHLRALGPVHQEPRRGVFMVTGYEETLAVLNDTDAFSNCNAVSGPFVKFPEPFEGDDVSELIDRHRGVLPFSDQLPTFDPPEHTKHRGLLMRLFSPKRMKENEEFMWTLASRQIDGFVDRGTCEFVHDYAVPFTILIIADLLGVPEADHEAFLRELAPGASGKRSKTDKPLEFLYGRFTDYIEDHRANPRDDVMTKLAQATFPDGSLPEVHDIMLIAANLFSAGGETTARMLGTAMRYLGERPELQAQVRADRSLIPPLLEECVRLHSPIQGTFRMARRTTEVGGVEIPAGSSVLLLLGAANRDPRLHDDPNELRLDRSHGRQHVGFGWGTHHCVGAPLARAEGLASLERLLDRMDDIRIDEDRHGPADDRSYRYEPIFMLRGLEALHLTFTPR